MLSSCCCVTSARWVVNVHKRGHRDVVGALCLFCHPVRNAVNLAEQRVGLLRLVPVDTRYRAGWVEHGQGHIHLTQFSHNGGIQRSVIDIVYFIKRAKHCAFARLGTLSGMLAQYQDRARHEQEQKQDLRGYPHVPSAGRRVIGMFVHNILCGQMFYQYFHADADENDASQRLSREMEVAAYPDSGIFPQQRHDEGYQSDNGDGQKRLARGADPHTDK